MNAITFIGLYKKYIAELETLSKEECKGAIEALMQKRPTRPDKPGYLVPK